MTASAASDMVARRRSIAGGSSTPLSESTGTHSFGSLANRPSSPRLTRSSGFSQSSALRSCGRASLARGRRPVRRVYCAVSGPCAVEKVVRPSITSLLLCTATDRHSLGGSSHACAAAGSRLLAAANIAGSEEWAMLLSTPPNSHRQIRRFISLDRTLTSNLSTPDVGRLGSSIHIANSNGRNRGARMTHAGMSITAGNFQPSCTLLPVIAAEENGTRPLASTAEKEMLWKRLVSSEESNGAFDSGTTLTSTFALSRMPRNPPQAPATYL
mmetsp:Transcript_35455/g.93058  ORF Transcript_35455/g.93058 Transcript_35455/m.93058 type:complete len:270 (+) Transcript_35455:379-1188(+)